MAEEEFEQETVVEAEPVEEENEQPKNEGLDEVSRYSLNTFIMVCIGLSVCNGWIIGGLGCMILGIVSLRRTKYNHATRQPFKTFDKISKPVAIVDIVVGAIVALAYTISFVVKIVNKVAELG